MTRRDVQGYAQDLIAYNQVQQGKPKPAPSPKLPTPIRLPARPPRR